PIRLRGGALARRQGPAPGDDEPLGRPCPRERADEAAVVRSWLGRNPVAVVEADPPLAEPVDGGAELHRLLAALRTADRRETAGPSTRAS
ncbi:MAG TPA: hypothetical protein VFZ96_07010, partial [Actinomycetota bacterium]|nr:hypothetical protein [Actinomycetota bacterium]